MNPHLRPKPPLLGSKEKGRGTVLVRKVRVGFGLEKPLEKASICNPGGDVDWGDLVLVGQVQAGLMPNTSISTVVFIEVLSTVTGNMPKPLPSAGIVYREQSP